MRPPSTTDALRFLAMRQISINVRVGRRTSRCCSKHYPRDRDRGACARRRFLARGARRVRTTRRARGRGRRTAREITPLGLRCSGAAARCRAAARASSGRGLQYFPALRAVEPASRAASCARARSACCGDRAPLVFAKNLLDPAAERHAARRAQKYAMERRRRGLAQCRAPPGTRLVVPCSSRATWSGPRAPARARRAR